MRGAICVKTFSINVLTTVLVAIVTNDQGDLEAPFEQEVVRSIPDNVVGPAVVRVNCDTSKT